MKRISKTKLKQRATTIIRGQGAYGQLSLVEVDGRWTTVENETGVINRWFDWHSKYFKVCGKARALVRDNGKYNIVDDADNLLCDTWYDKIRVIREQSLKDIDPCEKVRKWASKEEEFAALLAPPSPEDIEKMFRPMGDEFFVATLDGKDFRVDEWGHAVFEVQYSLIEEEVDKQLELKSLKL